ncbi:MAG: phospholipase D-like domain-containing protein [Vulcanimicrobiaceae bacterium]
MFTIQTQIDCYLLPEDGAAARAVFLQHLKDPYEMWIIAYSFTLVPMIDEIIANNQVGDPYHIYVDLSQSSGKAEKPQLQRLVDAGVEVTIGTSPAGTAYITHTKGICCNDSPPWCWEGSVNFSASGWLQVNTAMFFHSTQWRDEFVQQFNTLRDYAWTNLRQYQLLKEPPTGVTIGPTTDSAGSSIPGFAPTGKASTKKTSSKKAAGKNVTATRAPAKKAAPKKSAARPAATGR